MSQLDQIQTAASRLLNTILGGTHNEMLSSRAWRLGRKSHRWDLVRRLIDGLIFWAPNHCQASAEWEANND